TITGDTTLILWTKVIDLPGDQTAAGLAIGSDGSIMIAGVTGTYGNHDALLVKTDTEGNLLWQKTYGGAADDYATDITATSDGNFAMCGSTSSYGAGEEDAWLLKLDADGNVLWERTYGGERDDRAKSVVQTSDGGYALIGESCSFARYCPSGYFIKADQEGIEEWYKTFYRILGCVESFPPSVTAFDVISTRDGNIVFSYGAKYRSFEGFSHDGTEICLSDLYQNGLYKIDCLSNGIWNESETDVYNWDPVRSIFELDNQELLWVRDVCEVARASSNGIEIWEVGPEEFSARQFNDLAGSDAGHIVVVGNATGDLTHTYLLSLDMSGNILRELSFNEPGNQGLVVVKIHVEGKLVAAGFTNLSGSDSDVLLIQLSRYF
ncbi:MAG: hypothetical protein KAU36_08965, partial [candidate division Zixibacteria bacterium]|nr:hypothetical protein [candidate division Zixibacteria bacterium]